MIDAIIAAMTPSSITFSFTCVVCGATRSSSHKILSRYHPVALPDKPEGWLHFEGNWYCNRQKCLQAIETRVQEAG